MTAFLLDTHVLLGAVASPSRLSGRAVRAIRNDSNRLLVSAASAWEIATKFRLGKLPGAELLLDGWEETLVVLRAQSVPIAHRVALRAGAYATSHRDPFDRLLAAEAELSGVGLITADTVFAEFPVSVIW